MGASILTDARSLGALRKAAASCTRCPLYRNATVYVTNAVKHFKWQPRGKKRIHQKPTAREVAACRVWLDAEIDALKPTAIVCLGATAAQTLLGRSVRVTKVRGERIDSPLAPVVMATVHPSAILRARTDADRARERKAFQTDLVRLAGHLERASRTRKLYKRTPVSRTRSA